VLGTNYRSSALIIRASSVVIAHNVGRQVKVVVGARSWRPSTITLSSPPSELTSVAAPQPSLSIKVMCCSSASSEVNRICAAVRHRWECGASFDQIAVLGRTRAVTRGIALQLKRDRIPTTDRNFSGNGADHHQVLRNLQGYIDLVVAIDELHSDSGEKARLSSSMKALDDAFVAVCNTPRRGVGEKAVNDLLMSQRKEKQRRSLLECALESGSRSVGVFVALLQRMRAHTNSGLTPATAAGEILRHSGLLRAANGDTMSGEGSEAVFSNAAMERRHVIAMFIESLGAVSDVGSAGAPSFTSAGASEANLHRAVAEERSSVKLGNAMSTLRENELSESVVSSQSQTSLGAVTVATIHQVSKCFCFCRTLSVRPHPPSPTTTPLTQIIRTGQRLRVAHRVRMPLERGYSPSSAAPKRQYERVCKGDSGSVRNRFDSGRAPTRVRRDDACERGAHHHVRPRCGKEELAQSLSERDTGRADTWELIVIVVIVVIVVCGSRRRSSSAKVASDARQLNQLSRVSRKW